MESYQLIIMQPADYVKAQSYESADHICYTTLRGDRNWWTCIALSGTESINPRSGDIQYKWLLRPKKRIYVRILV